MCLPAQVCRAIFELREIYEYQMNCASDTVNNEQVHKTIAQATEKAHEIMEDCLNKILEIEGWNKESMVMPELLKRKSAKAI